MASEIRVDKINSLSGVGTVTLSPTGVDIAGITTAATLRATTGIVTSLTAGSLTSLGAVSGTTGTFTSDVNVTSTLPKIIMTDSDGGDVFQLRNDAGSFIIRNATDSQSSVTIDGDGFIGINESSPSRHLHVNSGTSDIVAVFESSDTSAQIQIKDSNGTCTIECLNDFRFQNGSAEILRLKSDKDVQIMDGDLIFASGHGIDFGSNTDGGETSTNTSLDDYEEGTFTPHFEIETRDASDSPVDGVQGRYVKTGNIVTCFYTIVLNGTPSERSTSRAWEIHGFPYQSKNGITNGQMGGSQRVTDYETATYGPDGYFVFRMFNNATYGRLEFIEHNSTGTRNASPMMLDNAQVIGTAIYQTDG